jgi:cysteine desulfurase/selenocysteine lyase
LKGIHAYDVGLLLDKLGIAVRTGHHCAQPLMERLAVDSCVRASFAFYNTSSEVDRLQAALKKIYKMFN